MRLGRICLAIYAIAVISFLLLPVLIVIPMSFNDSIVFEIIPSRPSLSQYRRLFSSSEWMDVLWRSVQIAIAAMGAATILGTLAALAIVRLGVRARSIAEALFMAPQIIPSVVIAVASYYLFSAMGLIGLSLGVGIAHALIALPFVVVLVRTRLESIDPELALASASLGGGPIRTFALVTMPQLQLTLVSSAVLAFHVSFDEVVLALFLTGARNKTLPVKLWDSILFEVTPILPAISTVVIFLPILLMMVVVLLRRYAPE